MGRRMRIERWDFGAAAFLSLPVGLVAGAAGAWLPETMKAGIALGAFVAGGELGWLTVRACTDPRSEATATAHAAVPSPDGSGTAVQQGGVKPSRPGPAPRRRTDGSKYPGEPAGAPTRMSGWPSATRLR